MFMWELVDLKLINSKRQLQKLLLKEKILNPNAETGLNCLAKILEEMMFSMVRQKPAWLHYNVKWDVKA